MKKAILITSMLVLAGGLCFTALFLLPNAHNGSGKLVIHTNASYSQVLDSIEHNNLVRSPFTFNLAARLTLYPRHIRNGKYVFDEGANNLQILRQLYRGQHYPVKFTFNNIRTKEQFIDKVDHHFMFEPEELAALLNDSDFLANYGFNPQNCVAMMIPDCYEFYYNISDTDFVDKMNQYYLKFWTDERRQLAADAGLTPIEAVTLASIVEEENFKEDEKAIIAGLYLNRLQRGMKLQADPTVKFALGNFAKTRIYLIDTQVDSPYNTYMYEGLPPGPIRIPATSTVDSVLHYMPHDYLFMCAKEDLSGYHNFAVTPQEHERNAAKYHKALDKMRDER